MMKKTWFIDLLLFALLLSVSLLGMKEGYAAGRIFYDGFESGNTNLWSQDDYRNRCTVVTSSADGVAGPFAGTQMARCNSDGTVAWNSPASLENLVLNSFSYTNEFFIRVRERIDNNLDRASDHASPKKLLRIFNWTNLQSTYNDMYDGVLPNGLANTGIAGGTQFSTYWGGAAGDNTGKSTGWHKVEYYINTSGTIKVWHDGVLVQNKTGLPTNNAKWYPFNLISNWSDTHDATNYIYFDEFEVFSDTGSGASGLMSDATIQGGGVVNTAPTITTQPQSQTVVAGQTATFTVISSGTTPFTYQWKKNGTNIGTNSSSYTTPTLIAGDTGSVYSVVITNSVGNATSSNATLTVTAQYTVTPSSGANGSISPSSPQLVTNGSTTTFTMTPNAGYVSSGSGTCGGTLSGNVYTTNAIVGNCTVISSFASNTTPPVISSPLPSGTLAYGTTSVTLQVTTDINATCRYDTTNVAYSSMSSTFATTGGTSHQQTGFSTSPNSSYAFYVRCMDAQGDTNPSSTTLSFSTNATNDTIVDNDSLQTSQSGLWFSSTGYPGYYGADYRYSPNSTGHWFQWTTPLVAGEYQVYARWPAVTGRPSDCSYDITHSGGTTNISNVNQQINGNQWILLGTFTFGTTGTVRALSGSTGLEGMAADAVRFQPVSSDPPFLSNLIPTVIYPKETTSVTLQVTTDVAATCRYSIGGGINYGSMTLFSSTSGTVHSSDVPVVSGGIYEYCYRCMDTSSRISNKSCTRFAVDPNPKRMHLN
jgi:hypothetical protein